MTRNSVLTFLLVIGILISQCSALQQINDANFNEKVVQDGSLWLVMISAQWCGNCHSFKAQLEGAEQILKQYGVKCGIADGPSNPVLNRYASDIATGQISYPSTPIFIKQELMDKVPVGVTTTSFIVSWLKGQFNLDAFLSDI